MPLNSCRYTTSPLTQVFVSESLAFRDHRRAVSELFCGPHKASPQSPVVCHSRFSSRRTEYGLMSLRQWRLVLVLTKEYSAWTIKMSSSFAKNAEGVNAGSSCTIRFTL